MQRKRVFTSREIGAFIEQGFVRLDTAFPKDVADQAREILWRDTGCDPHDPSTWTKPVVRLGYYGQAPFAAAANTVTLRGAFDQLVGADRWLPRGNLGTFPIRFRRRSIRGTPVGTSTRASPPRTLIFSPGA